MKKSVIFGLSGAVVAIAAAAGLVWYAYSPSWTVDGIAKAVSRNDAERIAGVFDFAAFRQNMKATMVAQFAAALADPDVTAKNRDEAQRFLAEYKKYIDATFTPEGITLALSKKDLFKQGVLFKVDSKNIVRDSFDQFRVAVDDGQYVVFARTGFGWKIAGIRIPYAVWKKAVADVAAEDAATVAKANAATQVAPTTGPGSALSAGIPNQFRGRWAANSAACADDDSTDRLYLDTTSVDFYEIHGQVDVVTARNEGVAYLAKVSFSGEGEIWNSDVDLKRNGPLLVTSMTSPNEGAPQENSWVKCK